MKYLDQMLNFEKNLDKKPNLMPSSVKTYVNLIRELTDKYGKSPKVEELNSFIEEKCNHRQPMVKYAIKHYLNFLWRDKDCALLIKSVIKPTKRERTYLTKKQAIEVIDSIENKEHKVVAIIQYFTGAKASETISIQKKDVMREEEHKRIKINIESKGGKLEPVYLSDNLFFDLQPYLIGEGDYLFLKYNGSSDKTEWVEVERYYKRYYESLKKAAAECNINMTTHDWRRSFAQSVSTEGATIYEVQRAMRHKNTNTTLRCIKDDPEQTAGTMLKHQAGLKPSPN